MSLGVKHFVPKPWNPEFLETTVRVALRESRVEVK